MFTVVVFNDDTNEARVFRAFGWELHPDGLHSDWENHPEFSLLVDGDVGEVEAIDFGDPSYANELAMMQQFSGMFDENRPIPYGLVEP